MAKRTIVNGIDRHLTVASSRLSFQLGASTVVNDSLPGYNVPGGSSGRGRHSESRETHSSPKSPDFSCFLGFLMKLSAIRIPQFLPFLLRTSGFLV
jgi:hypothetical protein